MNKLKIYLIGVGLPVLFIGLGALLALYTNHRIKLGAPAVFISTPATTSATALQNFSFTIGTTTPRGIFGSSTLAVYGSSTIQTWANTIHALEVFDSATSTVFRVDTLNRLASTSALTVSNLVSCDTIDTNANGVLVCGSDATGGGGGSNVDNVTYTTINGVRYYQASSTATDNLAWRFNNGFLSMASSTISALSLPGITSSLVLTGADTVAGAYAGTSCTNQFPRSLSAAGAATCATVGTADVAGLDISDDTNLAATLPIVLTNDTLSLQGSIFNFTPITVNSVIYSATTSPLYLLHPTASSTVSWGLESIHAIGVGSVSTTTILGNGATSTFRQGVFAQNLEATSSVKTSSLTVTGLTSALINTDASGNTLEYTGASCTNQFIRSLDAVGASTCATVSASDVSLANLTATDGTLTFSGTYNGSTARTIGLNLGQANTWTALQIFGGLISNASSTFSQGLQVQNLFASSSLQLPQGTNPTVDAPGEFAFDTTSGFLVSATSSLDTAVVYARPEKRLYSATIASTSLNASGFTNGDYVGLPTESDGITALYIMCSVWGGTNIAITLQDDTANSTNTITCTTTSTSTEFRINQNGAFTAGEGKTLRIGAISGTPNYLIISIYGTITRD